MELALTRRYLLQRALQEQFPAQRELRERALSLAAGERMPMAQVLHMLSAERSQLVLTQRCTHSGCELQGQVVPQMWVRVGLSPPLYL